MKYYEALETNVLEKAELLWGRNSTAGAEATPP